MAEFVFFQAGFTDAQAAVESKPVEKESLEKVLETALSVSRRKMFDYSPIDSKAIAGLAGKAAGEYGVNSIATLATALSKVKPTALDAQLAVHCKFPPQPVDESELKKWVEKKKGIIEIAWARYLNALFERVLPPLESSGGRFEKKEVRFAANTGKWIVVKKASLEASPQEVLACLAGIHYTALKKIGENTGASAFFEEEAKKHPQRSALSAIVQALRSTDEKLVKTELEKTCGKHLRAGLDYFYSSLMEHFGYAPFVTTQIVGRAFPDVKIPKPRGRIAGSKK